VDEDTSREPIGYGRFSGPAFTSSRTWRSQERDREIHVPGWLTAAELFKDMLLPAFEQGQATRGRLPARIT